MKIALLGYGKMGKTIDDLIQTRYGKKHEVVLRSDSANAQSFSTNALSEADVAIEFSTPSSAISNIEKCFEANIPVVVGTTGWHTKMNYVKEICQSKDQSILYSTNFSIGVNVFFEINKKLAALMNDYEKYDVKIEETHHVTKKDKPSGTGITLAEDIIWSLKRKNEWVSGNGYNDNELGIKSNRIEDVKGTHIVKYSSKIDDIEIKHTAHSREGFADGSIKAAEWLLGKKGIFTMKDMLGF